MRYVFLIVGFVVCVVVFPDGQSRTFAAAIVYVIFTFLKSNPLGLDNLQEETMEISSEESDSAGISKLCKDASATSDQTNKTQLSQPGADEAANPSNCAASKAKAGSSRIQAHSILYLLITTLILIGCSSENDFPDSPTEVKAKRRPLPPYYSPDECFRENFAAVLNAQAAARSLGPLPPGFTAEDLTRNPGWLRGELWAGFFCNFDFDDEAVAKNVAVFREKGILASQWVRRTPEELEMLRRVGVEDLHGLHPNPRAAEVSRFLEGLATVLFEKDSEDPDFPSLSQRGAAREQIDLDQAIITAKPKPRRLLVRDKSPRITLITDMPDSLRLRDVGAEYALVAGLFAEYESRMKDIVGDGISNLALAPDVFTRFLIHHVQLFIRFNLEKSRAKLENLDIIFTRSPMPILEDARREALYLHEDRQVWARRTLIDVSDPKIGRNILDLFPPSLLHELFHYFYANPDRSASPFVNEGVATFEGEAATRSFRAAVAFSEETTFEARLSMLQDPLSSIQDVAEKAISKVGLSPNETMLACDAKELFLTSDFSLKPMLTFTLEVLWEMDEDFHREFYIAAWATYGALRDDGSWESTFEPLAEAALVRALNAEELVALEGIEGRVESWLAMLHDHEEIACDV